MPSGERYDFFLSRRGSVASIAQEVADVLKDNGYSVLTQDYDIPITANFIEEMHEAVKNARDLVVLFTRDYEQSPYARMEFTSFEANAAQSAEKRRMVILRCEDTPLLGLFAPHVYQDLVGIGDVEERRNRILAAAEGRSQALEPPPRPFIGVPPRIASFTGRADELDQLDAILMQDKPAAVTQASVGRAAVQGLGGVGKTSLAIEYAHRYRQLYAGVCWCPGVTRSGLLTSLAALAEILGAAAADQVEEAGKAALRRLSEQRATWLLVYDNVTSPDEIRDLLPSNGARVLITSRFSDWSEWAEEVSLDMLPLGEALAFLQNRTARKDAEGARTLAAILGCLPLALDHAGAYCKRTQMPFADYAAMASSLIAAAPRGVDYPTSVSATVDLAVTQAVAHCSAAETMIAYLARCSAERIPLLLVQGAIENEMVAMQAVTALTDVSLLKPTPFDDGTPAISVHRLVQLVARQRAEAKGIAQQAGECLINRMFAIFPTGAQTNFASSRLCAQLIPHLFILWQGDDGVIRFPSGDTTVKSNEKLAEVFDRASAYLSSNDWLTHAAMALQSAIAIRISAFGIDDARTKSSLEKMVAFGKAALPGADNGARLADRGILDLGSTLGSAFYAQLMHFALDALGRTDEAAALRERYGLASSDEPKPS
jgi:hypothetical protein